MCKINLFFSFSDLLTKISGHVPVDYSNDKLLFLTCTFGYLCTTTENFKFFNNPKIICSILQPISISRFSLNKESSRLFLH